MKKGAPRYLESVIERPGASAGTALPDHDLLLPDRPRVILASLGKFMEHLAR